MHIYVLYILQLYGSVLKMEFNINDIWQYNINETETQEWICLESKNI